MNPSTKELLIKSLVKALTKEQTDRLASLISTLPDEVIDNLVNEITNEKGLIEYNGFQLLDQVLVEKSNVYSRNIRDYNIKNTTPNHYLGIITKFDVFQPGLIDISFNCKNRWETSKIYASNLILRKLL